MNATSPQDRIAEPDGWTNRCCHCGQPIELVKLSRGMHLRRGCSLAKRQ